MASEASSEQPTGAEEVGRLGAELFFDLVFVFAVTEVSTLLARDYSWASRLRALVVFVPVYWMWVGTAIPNLRDAGHRRADPSSRASSSASSLAMREA